MGEWVWKLMGIDPFGVVIAQVKHHPEERGLFLVRRVCGCVKLADQQGHPMPGKWNISPAHVLVLAELAKLDVPLVVSRHAIHWTVDPCDAAVETAEGLFRAVKPATPGQADAEAQKVNRLRILEGRNGG